MGDTRGRRCVGSSLQPPDPRPPLAWLHQPKPTVHWPNTTILHYPPLYLLHPANQPTSLVPTSASAFPAASRHSFWRPPLQRRHVSNLGPSEKLPRFTLGRGDCGWLQLRWNLTDLKGVNYWRKILWHLGQEVYRLLRQENVAASGLEICCNFVYLRRRDSSRPCS